MNVAFQCAKCQGYSGVNSFSIIGTHHGIDVVCVDCGTEHTMDDIVEHIIYEKVKQWTTKIK